MDYEKILGDLINQESTATFWSGKSVAEPDIFRLEKQNFRWYYKTNPIKFYTSITTWLKKVMPTPYFLEKWFKENELAFLDERLFYSSNYGTFAHIMAALLLRNGSIDLGKLGNAVDVYWAINDIQEAKFVEELATREQWTDRIKNELLCIVAFIQERNFEVIALEWMGSYDGSDSIPFSWCCTLDFVGELDFNGGRKRAIVDLKTGSLSKDQVYQLIGNKLAWEQSNPDLKIDLLMNLKPKDFSNKGKYTLKNRKVSEDDFMNFKSYAQIASRTVKVNPSNIAATDGMLSRDSDLSSFSMSPEAYVKEKHS